jgi:hypothetical protein
MSADLRPGADALKSPESVAGASEVASHWKAIGSAIGQTQAAQNSSVPAESWTGVAADAASSEIQALGGKLSDLSGKFAAPASALTTWEERNSQGIKTVEGLQTQWDEAIAAYKKTMADIDARVETDKKYNPDSDRQAAESTLASAQEPLKKSYNDEINQLSEAANTAAKQIQETADGTISPEAVKGGRTAVGVELFGSDMPISDGAAEWDYARDVAPEMLKDIEKAANSKEYLTEEQVKELQKKWGKDLQNPFCVQAMSDAYREKHGGKGEFSEVLNKLVINTSGDPYCPDESERATRNSLVKDIGTAMVLSTGGVNASDSESIGRSETYAQMRDHLYGQDGKTTISTMEKANIKSFEATAKDEFPRSPSGGSTMQGYQIFTRATAYAGVKNPDLAFGQAIYEGGDKSFASKLVQYDHDYEAGVRQGRNSLGFMNLVHYTPADEAAFEQCNDPLQSLYVLSDTPDSLQYSNFASEHRALAQAEQGRLSALRGFLTQDTPFELDGDWDHDGKDKSEKIPMVRYLTGSRNYGESEYEGFIDHGDAFGTMIEDATHPLSDAEKGLLGDDWKKASNQQASVVGNFTAGYQDGLDGDEGKKDGAQSHFGSANSMLRSHAGMILGNWAESLAAMDGDDAGAVGGNAHDSVGEARMSSGATQARFTLSPKLRDALYGKDGLFEDLAFDNPKQLGGKDTPDNPFDDTFEGGRPPALSAIEAGAYAGYKHDLGQAMASDYHVNPNDTTPGPSWSDGVSGQVKKWGGLFQHIESAISDQSVAEHKAIADRNNLIRQGIDAVASTVSFDGLPGGKIVDSLASSAFEEGKNKVLDSILPTDFSDEDFSNRINHKYAATQKVSDTLVTTFTDRDEWPNSDDKSKKELVAEFLKEEASHSDPVKADKDGDLPSYNTMDDAQRGRLRDFLRERTYLKESLDEAGDSTWSAYTKQEQGRHK